MSDNLVTVTATWTDGTTPGEGNYLMAAQGTLMDSSAVAIVTPVILNSLDTTGSLWDGTTAGTGVKLLASDNFTEGYLTWHFLIRVAGFPTIDVADVQVNYALGASQGLFTLLEASGWTSQGS